ncbi:MAG TPA: DNA translocase FtsK [Planctomycetota bacterium]|nr:DNA translocase FtsK [Planctomycetota bacterium]
MAFGIGLVSVFVATSLVCYAIGMRGPSGRHEFFLLHGIVQLQAAFGVIPSLVAAFFLVVAACVAIAAKPVAVPFAARALESVLAGFLLAVLLGTLGSWEGGGLGRLLGQRLALTISQPIAAVLCLIASLLAVALAIDGVLRDVRLGAPSVLSSDASAEPESGAHLGWIDRLLGRGTPRIADVPPPRSVAQADLFARAPASVGEPVARGKPSPEMEATHDSHAPLLPVPESVGKPTPLVRTRIDALSAPIASAPTPHSHPGSTPVLSREPSGAIASVSLPVESIEHEPGPTTRLEDETYGELGFAGGAGSDERSRGDAASGESLARFADLSGHEPPAEEAEGDGAEGDDRLAAFDDEPVLEESVDDDAVAEDAAAGESVSDEPDDTEAEDDVAILEPARPVESRTRAPAVDLPRTIPHASGERHGAELITEPDAATSARAETHVVAARVDEDAPPPDVLIPVAPLADPPPGAHVATAEPPLDDDLQLDLAARLVIAEGRASISFLQRSLGVTYGDAQRLIGKLERAGVVGAYRGTPARDILLSLSDWDGRASS